MNGGHEFKLYWPHAAQVDLVPSGRAKSTPLHPQGDGWWKVALPLPSGEFRYRFVVDGLYCVPDYAAGEPQYDDDGTLVSVLRCEPSVALRRSGSEREPRGGRGQSRT